MYSTQKYYITLIVLIKIITLQSQEIDFTCENIIYNPLTIPFDIHGSLNMDSLFQDNLIYFSLKNLINISSIKLYDEKYNLIEESIELVKSGDYSLEQKYENNQFFMWKYIKGQIRFSVFLNIINSSYKSMTIKFEFPLFQTKNYYRILRIFEL